MLAELKELFGVWIAAVTAAIHMIMARIVPQRRIELVEGDAGRFTARMISSGKEPALPPFTFELAQDAPQPAASEEWRAALRGSRIHIILRPKDAPLPAPEAPATPESQPVPPSKPQDLPSRQV